jgi:uncharacterized membrane protein
MLTAGITDIIEAARKDGWVLEPEALRLLGAAGGQPRCLWAKSELLEAAAGIGYRGSQSDPAKSCPSPMCRVARHPGCEHLTNVYNRFSRLPGFDGVVVAEMLSGRELIVGAKIDFQFGPVILLGIGGTAVEIYSDTVTRMAPLKARDVESMLACLRGSRLLTGHRGVAAVSIPKLTEMMLAFSDLVMELGDRIDSIDLNPVFCSPERCTVADARICWRRDQGAGGASPRPFSLWPTWCSRPLVLGGNIDSPEGGGLIPPVAFAFWRWTLACVLILPFTLRQLAHDRGEIARRWKMLFLLALLGISIFNTMLYTAVHTTTAINGALIQSAMPAVIVLLSLILYREKIATRQMGGALYILGACLVVRGMKDSTMSFVQTTCWPSPWFYGLYSTCCVGARHPP